MLNRTLAAIRLLRMAPQESEARRRIRAGGTDALRIVDGAADGMPGIEIDEFAGHWLVQSRDRTDFPPPLRSANSSGAIYWKPLGDISSPQWINGPQLSDPFVATENGLHYWIDFTAGYSQGLFIDQRDHRARLREDASGGTLLNCFAYTCAFGVALAASGVHTTNLDLSKRYLEWGRRNYELNQLDPKAHDFIFGDVGDWLERFAKKQRRFDIIVLDPPTFSRDAKGRAFTIERGLPPLVAAAARLLNPGGRILCSTNKRALAPRSFHRLIQSSLPDIRKWRIEPLPMPLDFSGEKYLKAVLLTSCASF